VSEGVKKRSNETLASKSCRIYSHYKTFNDDYDEDDDDEGGDILRDGKNNNSNKKKTTTTNYDSNKTNTTEKKQIRQQWKRKINKYKTL